MALGSSYGVGKYCLSWGGSRCFATQKNIPHQRNWMRVAATSFLLHHIPFTLYHYSIITQFSTDSCGIPTEELLPPRFATKWGYKQIHLIKAAASVTGWLFSAVNANVSNANANQGCVFPTKRFRSTLMCNYPLQISIHESKSNWVTSFSEPSEGILLSDAHQRQRAQIS